MKWAGMSIKSADQRNKQTRGNLLYVLQLCALEVWTETNAGLLDALAHPGRPCSEHRSANSKSIVVFHVLAGRELSKGWRGQAAQSCSKMLKLIFQSSCSTSHDVIKFRWGSNHISWRLCLETVGCQFWATTCSTSWGRLGPRLILLFFIFFAILPPEVLPPKVFLLQCVN